MNLHISVFFFLVILLLPCVLSLTCPYGWMDRPYSDLCYKFTQNVATNTWEDARLKCQAAGGDLVSITSAKDWTYLNNMMKQLYNQYNHGFQHWWLGLNRRDDGSTWRWADGSSADMSLLTWGKNVNLQDSTKNCVQMNMFVMDIGSCTTSTFQSICSRPKGLPLQCDADNGWQHYNGMCYKYYSTARTWNDASQSCSTQGATLPTIPDLTTQTIIGDFARQQKATLWTGLRRTGQASSAMWRWQDGSPLAGNPHWATGQPATTVNMHVNSTCVVLNVNAKLPNTWATEDCHNPKKYYCQRPEGNCADGWLQYGLMCYQFNPHYQLSWPKAQTYCKAQGGNLVSITSANIQGFLNQYLNTEMQVGVPELWIGLTDNNKTGASWTFPSGPVSNSWNNWVSTPVNQPGKQDCVYITTSDSRGKWRIANSCTQVRSFICDMKTNTQVKAVTQPPGHYICPDKWVSYGSNCYYFNEQDNTYDTARDWCQRQSADLVTVTDHTVQSFLEKKLQRHGDYWIGLTDRHTEGSFMWLDDTVNSTFYYWNKGEPNNYQGKENCVRLLAVNSPSEFGHWADGNCNTRKINSICQKQAQNAFNTPPTTTPKPWSTKCGPFWASDPFTPFCYQFSDEQLTWFDARGACQARGGDLASIETSEESSFITGRVRSKQSADFWIGANDQGSEGGWKWTDRKPFAFLNWNAGEPNNYGNSENCAAIMMKNGRWHDNYCNYRKGFVCKKSAYFVCESGWQEFKHNCFNFNHKKQSWQTARAWCKTQKGDLVKVNDLDMLGFLRDHVDNSGDWWIGLNDIKKEGTFVWLDETTAAQIDKGQWKPGEPNQQGNEDCGSISMTLGSTNEGKYNDWSCSHPNNFICMKPGRMVASTALPQTTTPKSVPAGSQYGCPLNWLGYRGSCYYFAWNTGSYDNSVSQCGYQGAKLASIIDEDENKFVFSIIPKVLSQPGKSVWIGLNDRAIEMKYVWTDGQKVTYTKWAPNEPNNWQGHDEDCVAMYTKDALWVDQVCTYSLAGAICKKPKTIISNSAKEIGKGCQTGHIGYHATCYSFYWNAKTWADAEKDCVSHKGHLATIPDRHVQAFLGAEMVYRSSEWWVGLSDLQTPGQYTWSSGQPFSFSAWYERHTGNERGTCVGIRASRPVGLWENRHCTDHRQYICEYPRVGYTTLQTTPTTTPAPIPCPSGWTQYGRFCYKFFGGSSTPMLSWPGARYACRDYGGDLVSVHNNTLETFFTTTLGIKQTSFWIGLNDRDSEAGYEWSDGTMFGYSNWHTGEPNNYNNREDCVEFNPITNGWNDFYCYDDKSYVCQLQRGLQITTTQTPPSEQTSSACQGNGTWYYYNNNCYAMSPANSTDAQKSWYDARSYCMARGGDLVSIHGPDDNAFISGWISSFSGTQKFWIGLNNLDMSGYKWSDGTGMSYLGWEAHQPNDGDGQKRCVLIQNHRGTWLDDNCNDVLKFICEKRPNNVAPRTPAPTAVVQGGCPMSFTTIPTSSRCYALGGTQASQKKTWGDANSACAAMYPGAHLAVITNDRENKFVTTLLRGLSYQAWIGLMDQQTNGLYMWVDSTNVDYTHWAPGQPDEDIKNDKITHHRDCVMMWYLPRGKYEAGGWDDYFCDNTMAYVCSVPKLTSGYRPATPDSSGCPTGYVKYANNCYKGVQNKLNWQDAQMDCGMNNANLASIADVFEESFVNLIMVNQGASWIGFSNLEANGHYTWTDKYPVQFTRWDEGEPSTLDGEGCVLMDTNYKWNDTRCSDMHSYVCETHLGLAPGATTPAPGGACPDSTWTQGLGNCYKAMGSLSKSWPESRYLCQRMGGDLASVTSAAEMTFISGMLQGNTTDIWIGLSKQVSGGFVWADSSAVGYLNWAHNEPSDAANRFHQDCVLMMANGGWLWNDLDCFTKAGYLCKLKSSSSYQTTVSTAAAQTQAPQYTQQNTPNHHTNRLPNTNRPNQGFTYPQPVFTQLKPVGTPYHPSFTRGIGPQNTPAHLADHKPSSSGGGLSGGGIAGIIIAVIIVLALVSVGLIYVRRRGHLARSPPAGFVNATYDKDSEDVSVS